MKKLDRVHYTAQDKWLNEPEFQNLLGPKFFYLSSKFSEFKNKTFKKFLTKYAQRLVDASNIHIRTIEYSGLLHKSRS